MNRFRTTGLAVLLFLAFSPLAVFAASLQDTFGDLSKKAGLDPSKQAACVAESAGEELSYNANARIIPASVSKLYTFDFALASLPENFRYKTEFYLVGQTLYINGGGDPHFTIEHLRGVIEKIYAEKGIAINRFVISPDFYFNWKSVPKDVQTTLFASLKGEKSLPIASKISVTIASASYKGVGDKYTFESMPLPALLKQINDYSTNISADTLFRRLGGPTAFAAYMKKTYGVGPETIAFSTGSGLTGNYTTCALTLRVIEHLAAALENRDLGITDVLSMPTVDPGVLQKRLFSDKDARSIVAKSGFVNYHHALAGAIITKKGLAYFAVFTNFPTMSKSESTKAMIDTFVTSIVASFGRNVRPFNYTPDLTLFNNFKIKKG